MGTAVSSVNTIDCGVPQGSILGPLLFNCYVNDLPDQLSHCKSYLYADDTALVAISDNIVNVSHMLNDDLHKLYRWFSANKLCLNVEKTKCMYFHGSRKPVENNELLVMLADKEIEQVSTFKYLGVHLDNALKFDEHVDSVRKKVNQRTHIMWKLRPYIKEDLAKDLYMSLINPLFLYCCFVYDGMSRTLSNRLQVTQNSALRAVAQVNKRYSATQLHVSLNIPWLDCQRLYHSCVEVYKLANGHGPESLSNALSICEPVRVLRSNAQVKLSRPRYTLKHSENDFLFRGVKYWDTLPAPIQQSKSIDVFKSELKKYTRIWEHIT